MQEMKLKIAPTAITIALLLGVSPAMAENLSGEEIVSKLAGKTVVLNTKWGIGFPLTYAKNGRVTGDGSGTGLGNYFAPKETGKWWISGNRMCQQFPSWYDGRTFCFKLQITGPNSLIWKREDGARGTARIS